MREPLQDLEFEFDPAAVTWAVENSGDQAN